MSDLIFHPKKEDGWFYIHQGYPPFYKKIVVFFIESISFRFGHIVMSGGSRVCLHEDITGKLYDLDGYICAWKVLGE